MYDSRWFGRKLSTSRRDFLKMAAAAGAGAVAISSLMKLLPGVASKTVSGEGQPATSLPVSEPLQGPDGHPTIEELRQQMETELVPVETGGQAFLRILQACGVDVMFGNPDAANRALYDANAWLREIGQPMAYYSTLHEFTAVCMAYGYSHASGKLGVSQVGRIVGTHNATGANFIAYCGYGPVLFIASQSEPGTPRYSDGWHDAPTLGSIVRNFSKFDHELEDIATMPWAILKVANLAMTEPRGTVFLSVPMKVSDAPLENVAIPPIAKRYVTPAPIIPEPEAVKKAARLLVDADLPYIQCDHLGRRPEAIPSLVKLAEVLAIPVRSGGQFTHMPTTHPLYANMNTSDVDVFLNIDAKLKIGFPDGWPPDEYEYWQTYRSQWPYEDFENGTVINMGVDPYFLQGYGGFFGRYHSPADVNLFCDYKAGLDALIDAAAGMISYDWSKFSKFEERYNMVKGKHDEQRAAAAATVQRKFNDVPISPERLGYELQQLKGEDSIVVAEAGVSGSGINRACDYTKPLSYMNGGTSGHLGYGPGYAVGVKVAVPDREVILCQAEGAAFYGNIDAALWTCSHYDIPVLFIITNNADYATTRGAWYNYESETGNIGYARRQHWWDPELIDEPNPNLAHIATAMQVHGKRVENPEEIAPALSEAFNIVRGGKPALVDVRVASTLAL